MEAADGAMVAQQEGGADEGLEGEGGTVVAEEGVAAVEVHRTCQSRRHLDNHPLSLYYM